MRKDQHFTQNKINHLVLFSLYSSVSKILTKASL